MRATTAPENKLATWYSITSGKWNSETNKTEPGLFVHNVKVIKESEKFITIESERKRPDGSVYTYRTKKVSDTSYGWFGGYYPTLDAAKDAYRNHCSERLTAFSEAFAQKTLELSLVDSLTEGPNGN